MGDIYLSTCGCSHPPESGQKKKPWQPRDEEIHTSVFFSLVPADKLRLYISYWIEVRSCIYPPTHSFSADLCSQHIMLNTVHCTTNHAWCNVFPIEALTWQDGPLVNIYRMQMLCGCYMEGILCLGFTSHIRAFKAALSLQSKRAYAYKT